MKKLSLLLILALLVAVPGAYAQKRKDKSGKRSGSEKMQEIGMHMKIKGAEMEMQERQMRIHHEERMMELEIEERELELEKRRRSLKDKKGKNATPSGFKGKCGPRAAKCGPRGGLCGPAWPKCCPKPICLVVMLAHLLMGIWVFGDIRKRNEGSGLWIVLVLLVGFFGLVPYTIARLGDKQGS